MPAEAVAESGSPRLSAVIITYNEERNVAECIASVHDWCDEVLVLDSHSTDDTKKIAQGFARVRFLEHAFDGHVQQKNRAIDLSRGEWVFCLDADERATPELAASVLKFIAQHPDAPGARVNRLTFHLGRAIRHGGWYNARYRLLRRGAGAWGGENPHDTIILNDVPARKAMRGPQLKGDLLHYSFLDLADQVRTINKFSSIVAFTRAAKGRPFSLLKMLFKPVSKFIEMYIVKAGFLDGIPGFVVAVSSSYSTFLKWAKLYELKKTELERPSNLRADYRAQ